MDRKLIPQITVFLIPGSESHEDSSIQPTDKCMLIPFMFIKGMIKATKDTDTSIFCYFCNMKNNWVIKKNKENVPEYIDKQCVLQVEKGKVVSHKYFITV